MYSECSTCDHKISWDAYRCPNCGEPDAGKYARWRYEREEQEQRDLERDRVDPGWRERESAARNAKEQAEELRSRRVIWAIYCGTLWPLYFMPSIAGTASCLAVGGRELELIGVAWTPLLNWTLVLAGNRQPFPYQEVFFMLAILGIVIWLVFRPSAPGKA